MKPTPLISVLAGVVVAAILLALLLFNTREEPVPEPPQVEPEVVSKEPDLQTSFVLTQEDILPLYQAMDEQARNYSSAHIRTRMSFVGITPGEAVEAEFWFDASKPDRWILRSFTSRLKKSQDPGSGYELQPNQCEVYDVTHMQVISYAKKNVHDLDLNVTDRASQDAVGPMKVKSASELADPYKDLLFGMPYEERLKEFLEARREKTSDGDRIHVRMRLNHAMRARIKQNRYRGILPVTRDGLGEMSIREDVFNAADGNLARSVYLDSELKNYMIQAYQETAWNEKIPDDRFVPEIPAGFRRNNINAILRRNRQVGMQGKDIMLFQPGGQVEPATPSAP